MSSAQSRKRILFVCCQNRVRSLTAQQLYQGRPDLEVRSAGTDEYAAVPLTQELFEWADQVFVFSKRQRRVIEERFPDCSATKVVINLGLADRFEYKSPDLVAELTMRVYRYLGTPASEAGAPMQELPAPAPRPPVTETRAFRQTRLQLGRVAGRFIAFSLGSWLWHLLSGLPQTR